MKIFLGGKHRITNDSVCAIGSFDGVHRGHQKIIKHIKRLAGGIRKTGIITFIPLPYFVLKKVPVICLTVKSEKENIMQKLGVDFIYYFRFTKSFGQLSCKQFIKRVARRIKPSHIMVGENFRFGRDRMGSARDLKHLSRGLFEATVLSRMQDDGIISSTRIRELLLLGHIKAANRLLGRKYTISGIVVKGKGKGTSLGFPTINLKVDQHKLLPLDGVYKVNVLIENKEFNGAMFCRGRLLEVHILDYSQCLYRHKVHVRIVKRIRDIASFQSDERLKKAIARDVKRVRSR